MPRVKIVEFYDGYSPYNHLDCMDYVSDKKVVANVSDWEEISDKEVDALKQYCSGRQLLLLIDREISVELSVVKALEHQKTLEKEKEARIKADAQREAKRKATYVAKREAKEKKLLEELKDRYES